MLFARWRRMWYRRGASLRPLLWLATPLAVLLLIDAQLRPVIRSMAAYQAKVIATRIINEAVTESLSGGAAPYDRLVQVQCDNSGRVTSVQTDMVRLNLLKASLTTTASQRLSMLESQTVLIPVGTLTGWQLLSGRGPRVEFKIVPSGFVQSQLQHRFDSAGINQTRHQILLQVDASIIAVLPGYSTTTEVSTGLVLAETVIVGVSPEAFTQVLTENGDTAGLLADYGQH